MKNAFKATISRTGLAPERCTPAISASTGPGFAPWITETGSVVLVTNEGNGDLSQILPRTHIVLASIEKLKGLPDSLLVLPSHGEPFVVEINPNGMIGRYEDIGFTK